MAEQIRARAVGNAVFLETEGGKGDVAAWGERSMARAMWVAEQINGVLHQLQREAADRGFRFARLQETVDEYEKGMHKIAARCADWTPEQVRNAIAGILHVPVKDLA